MRFVKPVSAARTRLHQNTGAPPFALPPALCGAVASMPSRFVRGLRLAEHAESGAFNASFAEGYVRRMLSKEAPRPGATADSRAVMQAADDGWCAASFAGAKHDAVPGRSCGREPQRVCDAHPTAVFPPHGVACLATSPSVVS